MNQRYVKTIKCYVQRWVKKNIMIKFTFLRLQVIYIYNIYWSDKTKCYFMATCKIKIPLQLCMTLYRLWFLRKLSKIYIKMVFTYDMKHIYRYNMFNKRNNNTILSILCVFIIRDTTFLYNLIYT